MLIKHYPRLGCLLRIVFCFDLANMSETGQNWSPPWLPRHCCTTGIRSEQQLQSICVAASNHGNLMVHSDISPVMHVCVNSMYIYVLISYSDKSAVSLRSTRERGSDIADLSGYNGTVATSTEGDRLARFFTFFLATFWCLKKLWVP